CALPISDLLRPNAGIRDRIQHDPVGAMSIFGRQGDMECIAAHSVSDEFGKDLRSTLLCEFKLLEDEHAGTFADHEPVAIFIEWTRCPLRLFVACGQSAHGGKSTDSHRSNGSL